MNLIIWVLVGALTGCLASSNSNAWRRKHRKENALAGAVGAMIGGYAFVGIYVGEKIFQAAVTPEALLFSFFAAMASLILWQTVRMALKPF